jgi:hypothetical protein
MDLQLLQRSDVKLCPSQSLMLPKKTALPFVIPAGAPKERSGGICSCCSVAISTSVHPSRGRCEKKPPYPLSSRPELRRSAVEGSAVVAA